MNGQVRDSAIPHVDALDGLRGAAVAGVLLFHAGHLTGGYLGVDLFFTLSGFLITSLLLAESSRTGGIGLGGFWARRARRLLPALGVLMVGIALFCWLVATPEQLTQIRGDAFATLAYVANWRQIFGHQDYFALFTTPSPLNHTWSLAIEEQFYLIWPLVFVGLLWRFKRTIGRAVLATALISAAASAALMMLLYDPANVARAYYGTDTRATAILLGVALAAWRHTHRPPSNRGTRVALETSGLLGAVFLAVAWARLDGQSSTLYRGGFLLCGLAATAVIAAAVEPHSPLVGRILSWRPLCLLGLISYGVYLYHWPIDIVVDQKRSGLSGWPLFALQTAITLVVAVVSYKVIEQPVRRGALAARQWRVALPAIAAGLALMLVLSTAHTAPRRVPGSAAGLNGVGGLSALGGPVTHPLAAADIAFRTAAPGARRVMIVGDSVAFFLGPALQHLRGEPPLAVFNAAVQGCNFFPEVNAVHYRLSNGQLVYWPSFPCDPSWEAAAARRFRPDVIIWVVTHPAVSYLTHGRWYKVCDPRYRSMYEHDLSRTFRDLVATGSRVVVTTEVYDRSYNASSDAAVDCDNPLRRQAAQEAGAQVVDLFSFVCPRGHCRTSADGVTLRGDGTHYKGGGARVVATWLMQQIGPPAKHG